MHSRLALLALLLAVAVAQKEEAVETEITFEEPKAGDAPAAEEEKDDGVATRGLFGGGAHHNQFGAGHSQFGAGQFGAGHNQFGAGHNQFGAGHNQFGAGHNQFGPGHNQFGPGHNQFGAGQFGPGHNQFGAGQFGPGHNQFNQGHGPVSPGFVAQGIIPGGVPGGVPGVPGLAPGVGAVQVAPASSSSCRFWCKTPQGQAYCCENANEAQTAVFTKGGHCPPVRPTCPLRSFSGPPKTCSNDGACAGVDKCCFDTCLEEHVCKPPHGVGK